MMQEAKSSIEEVPYCLSGSLIKSQGHTDWKLDDLNPIWVKLLGQSQVSNPVFISGKLIDYKQSD